MAGTEFDERQATKNGFKNADLATRYKLIDDRYLRWLDITQGMRNQWRMNAMFARGFHWAVLQPTQNRIIQPPTSRSRKRVTLDLITPWMLDTEAKLHINLPTFDVSPNTLSQDNKDAAIAGESYGQHLWRSLEITQKYDWIVRNCEIYGHCFGVLDWDRTIGPLYSVREEEEDRLFTLGDLRFDIFTPDNVVTDEEHTEIDEKNYVILASWMSLDSIRERWEEGKNVTEEKRVSPQYDALAFMDSATRVSDATRHTKGTAAPGALVYKVYMKPQNSTTQGTVTTLANGVELEEDDWPEEFKKMEGYPIVKYDWFRLPHMFRSQAPLEKQQPIQREINTTISQIRENLDMILAVKWLVPHGSGVQDIDDIAGQIIDYIPGFRPEILQPGTIPAFVPRYLEQLLVFMEDIQILHKPSKGKVPAGVKSKIGIELLQEQDDRPLSVPEASLHASLNLTFRKALQIASVAVDTERMISYVGPNKRRQVMAFKGADLRDNTNIHLSVVGGSSKSKAGIVGRILEFVQVGMYRKEDGTVDTPRIMDMIRTAHPDAIYEDEDRHAELQRDENDILWDARQSIPIPQEWHQHDIHLDELEDEMSNLKWMKQTQADPEWGRRWIAHRELHIALKQRAATRNQIAAQSAMAGAGGQGPPEGAAVA